MILSDAEISGIMNWRGPGAYTQHAMRRVRKVAEEAARRAKLSAFEWHSIDYAPRNCRILVKSESGEIYAAHWVQNQMTGDEAWCVSEAPDGTQHMIHPVKWREIGTAPC